MNSEPSQRDNTANLTEEEIDQLRGLEQLYREGAPLVCGEVLGISIDKFLPMHWNAFKASADRHQIIQVIQGSVWGFDRTGQPFVTLSVGRTVLNSWKQNWTFGLQNPSPTESSLVVRIEFEPRPLRIPRTRFELRDRDEEPLQLVAWPEGRDVDVYIASLRKELVVLPKLREGRRAAWIVVASGCVELNGKPLSQFSSECVTSVPLGLDDVRSDGRIELVGRSDDAEVFLIDAGISEEGVAQIRSDSASLKAH